MNGQQGFSSSSASSSYSFNNGSNGHQVSHNSLAASQYSGSSTSNSSSAASQPILSLLRKLIQINIPKNRNQSNDDYERYANKQLRFLISLLSSRISPTLIQTQDQILLTETIKKRLMRENKSDMVFQFSQLFHRLNTKTIIQHKFNLVYLLNSLGTHNYANDHSSSSIPMSLNASFQDNLFKLNSTHSSEKQVQQDLLIHSNMESTNKQNNSFQQYKQVASEQENTRFEVAESTLVRDIVYTFQGIDGRYIKYDLASERFIVDTKIGIPKSTRLLMSKLSELGWLYKKVKSFVDAGTLNKSSNGLVMQSLCSSIDKELVDYYKTISSLETQIESQENTNTPVTFRRLAIWAIEPTEILKNLAILTDSCKLKRGGNLISTIYKYIRHGDPLIHQLFSRILESTSSPIFKMIKSWVVDGELEDPYGEFFVKSNPEVNIDKLWSRKYVIEPDMVPLFIDQELAYKILRTGKSINFIRQCCKDAEWAMDSHTISTTEGLGFYNISKLENVVDNVAKVANRRVTELVFNQYKFMMHCTAIKQYLLLGQGDFIQHLIELLNEDLNKPSHAIFKHNLLGLLESAIRGSNAQYDDQDVLNRLDVRLMQPKDSSPADNGWDIFCLDYKITVPLDTIFSKEVINVYLRIFKFLWNIKRVELSLNENWKKVVNLIRSIPSRKHVFIITQLKNALNFSILLRHDMSRFLGSLQFYLMFEVLESAWDQFLTDIKKLRESDGDLDQLLAAHYKYLSKIVDQSFLSKSQQNTRLQVEQTLITMNKFVGLQSILCSVASNILCQVENYMEEEDDPTQDFLSDDKKEQLNSLQQCHSQLHMVKTSFDSLSAAINLKTEN
ncbi:hypothetical protein C9374_003022 [Naegleria lovaniensis]|uniref:Spindle pole body component n=1 Tax=Naegleria lovaniensis TaxID=51637 RepID=A0AA88GTR9_NAELO|nr:uncharacterized protein C9374_003022 [Naegleria lovaniensis]KAG2385873.1 hypothetical protein C9374_003022 [Naegleria lovaniensis]